MFPFGAIAAVHTTIRMQRQREEARAARRRAEEKKEKERETALEKERTTPVARVIDCMPPEPQPTLKYDEAADDRKYYEMQLIFICTYMPYHERKPYIEQRMAEYDLKQANLKDKKD